LLKRQDFEVTLPNVSREEKTKEEILTEIKRYQKIAEAVNACISAKFEESELGLSLEDFLFVQKFHNDYDLYNFRAIFPFDFKLAIKLFLLHNHDKPGVIQTFVDKFIKNANLEQTLFLILYSDAYGYKIQADKMNSYVSLHKLITPLLKDTLTLPEDFLLPSFFDGTSHTSRCIFLEILHLRGIEVPDEVSKNLANNFCTWKFDKYFSDVSKDEIIQHYELQNNLSVLNDILVPKPLSVLNKASVAPFISSETLLLPPYIYQINIHLFCRNRWDIDNMYKKHGENFINACRIIVPHTYYKEVA